MELSMKAKILGFFCSLLIINFAYGQTIDGVLYTNFNNYYKWKGGAFDSTFLLPQTSATNGKRAGALRYAAADSSVYSWSGTQWIKLGGGSIPTLQQVTTAGNTTTDSLNVIDGTKRLATLTKEFTGSSYYSGTLLLNSNSNNDYLKINHDRIVKFTTADLHQITLPDSSGTLTQRIRANGITYNTASNGVVDIITDTATVVKAYVTNAEAVTITKGQVVYIFGASGDRASVKLAKNTSDTFSSKTLGIVRADIAAGQAGWITTQGQVSGINLGAYTAGDILWLDSVPGGFTATKPQAPYHSVFVGVVERANAGNGLIYVKPQNGVELDELHDVRITSLANNDIIRYNSSLGYWENKNQSIFAYTAQTTTYNALASDYVIHCTSGTFTVNLPTAVGVQGKVYIVKNSGSGLITIDPNSTETIDGALTYKIGGNESLKLMSTGANWITL